VDDLVVDSHLHTIVVDDEDTDAASAVVKRLCETVEESGLVEDGKALLDITRLGHGDDATILTDVENTVLLEDRTKHVLDNDGRSRVGDERGLLMELLGEQVNTEVAVLASLGGGGDADDLARAALEDQEIANADVVARDGDGVGRSHLACGSRCRWEVGLVGGSVSYVRRSCVRSDAGGSGVGRRAVDTDDAFNRGSGRDGAGRGSGGDGSGVLFLDNDLFLTVVVLGRDVGVLVRVVVTGRVDGVGYAVGDLVSDLVGSVGDTVTKAVVVAVVVVISHITLELLGGVGSGTSSLFYSNLGWVAAVDTVNLSLVGRGVLGSDGLSCVTGGLLVVGVGAEVGVTLVGDDGTSALTELAFGNVDLRGCVVGGRAVDSVEVTVVGSVLNLDVSVGGG
jgi:hypothetical protein